MYSRLLTPGEGSFFLFGPRGTGKSSWVKKSLPGAVYLDLLDSDTYIELLASPRRLENLVPEGFEGSVVIDEVQKVPALLDEVHRLIERRKLSFALTGSSARKLRRKGVNLLGGRAATRGMHPLTVAELGGDFDLAYSLAHGNLPTVQVERKPERAREYLSSYVASYLKEEVLQEGLTRNLGAFSRFLQAASFAQAASLNISDVARDCHVERKVVEGYFTILEDLLLAQRLPVFTRRAKRAVVAHPKLFFFDAGVYRALRPRGPLDTQAEIDGAAIETLLYQELRALDDYGRLGYSIHYWRTRLGLEVDFVLYGPRGLHAFEVQRTPVVRPGDLRSLQAFLEDYPMATATLLHGGSPAKRIGKIQTLPFAEGLRKLPELI